MKFEKIEKIKIELEHCFKNNSGIEDYLGFSMEVSNSLKFSLMKKGWWHVFILASNENRGVTYGLRIMPENEIKDWPIIAIYQNETAVTFAPSIRDLVYTVSISRLLESKRLFMLFREKWAEYYEKLEVVKNYFNWQKGFEQIELFINDENNIPKRNKEWKSNKWAEILKLNDTGDYSKLHVLQKTMLNDSNIIPEVDIEDFGIWKTWVANLIAARAVVKESKYDQTTTEKNLWRGFIQPTGYDACDMFFSHIPNRIYDPYMGAYEIANVMGASYFKCSDEIKNDPLFPAIGSILKLGKHGYQGQDHINGGDRFVEENDKADRAWNAYVSAAYWSGKNTNETSMPAWEAAIKLCKKEGWKDAEEALNYQYDFYNTFKQ